ncbi:hypothetical protein RRG08_040742 [Elysia crispata]|uniref:BHLH domain-containing protein n=1 Tax=Elysia crispata TaxID=231223 RepID=A0AAE1BE64_9GAST|nr:hypothetical protein RRG08_040742 [Elysia crispata]
MKKKVYEKQLSQLRPTLTSDVKRDAGGKAKSRKSRARQESKPDRPRASASGKGLTSNGRATSRLACTQAQVGTLPNVEVLIKRRVVGPDPSVSTPSNPLSSVPIGKDTANREASNMEREVSSKNDLLTSSVSIPVCVTDTVSGENAERSSTAPPETQWVPPPSSRYRIDLNHTLDTSGNIAAQKVEAEKTMQCDVSCSLPSTTLEPVTSTESGSSLPSTTDDSHTYAPNLSGSVQMASSMSVPQTFPILGASQPSSIANISSAGPSDNQPVSLISSPQILHLSGQFASESRTNYSSHPGDNTMPHYQSIPTSSGQELHTLTPMVLSDSRRFDEAGAASRMVSHGDHFPGHSGVSWEQENNRYSDYSAPWRHQTNHDVYLSNGNTYALKRPYINGNIMGGTIENNNDANLHDHNTRSKLYPQQHQHQEPMSDDKTDPDVYSNGYTSDDSSCAKTPVGGTSRRRRKRVQTPVQRSAANMRERRRMCHLNDAFNYLKEHLPNVKDKKKLSRIQTLKAAIYYIHLLRDSLKLQ